jgi:hypothetical protein
MKRSASERLLRDLANPTPSFSARYPQLFVGDRNPEETATALRQLLQKAWDARDQRRREWWCHGVETYYHRGRPDRDLKESLGPAITRGVLGDDFLEPGSLLFALREPPRAVLALESALLYFKKNQKRAAHCPNPECQTPYHFAGKKNQKYCSPACAKPARLAQLRKWWHENRGK